MRLSLEEAQRIAAKLGLTWDEFRRSYTDELWPGTVSFLLRRDNGGCIFLKWGNDYRLSSCLIESFKPMSCRQFPAGFSERECRDGLESLWGLGVSPSSELYGEEKALRAFQVFLKSLESRLG